MSGRKLIAVIGAAIVVIGFFLNWVEIAGAGVTGLQVAQGVEAVSQDGSALFVWAFPFFALVAIVATFAMQQAQQLQTVKIVQIVSGVIVLGLTVFLVNGVSSVLGDVVGFSATLSLLGIGLRLTLVGALVMIVGGFLTETKTRQTTGRTTGGGFNPQQPAPAGFNGPSSIPAPTQVQSGGGFLSQPPVNPVGPPAGPTFPQPLGPGAANLTGGNNPYPTGNPGGETIPQIPQSPGGAVPEAVPSPAKTVVLSRRPIALAWLHITNGRRAGEQVQLTETTNIGRTATNDLILEDDALSGDHARVKFEDKSFYLYDLASTNGTHIYNADKQTWRQVYRHKLKDGDQVKLGRNTILHFMTVSTDAKS